MGNGFSFLAGSVLTIVGHSILSQYFLLWPRCKDKVELGDTTYRIKRVVAPAASGWLLKLIAAVIGNRGILGQHLRRKLLNDNDLHRVRSLASQIIHKSRARLLYYPMKRLSSEQLTEHGRLAAQAEAVAKRPGRYNSVLDYHEAFLSQKSTPLKVLDAALEAIDVLASELRVFTPCGIAQRDALRKEAAASTERFANGKPLSVFDGVPVALKDMVPLAGVTCTKGTSPRYTAIGPDVQDDLPAAVLKRRGAIILGLTIMTEYGVTPLGWSVHSQGPTNTYNASCYSGGSSSGSAAGAALGLFPVALGFDGGGSIRVPSAMQGVVGLKCTWGRVPVDSDPCAANVAAGPIAGSAADAALFYQTIATSPQAEQTHFYQKLHGASPLPPPHCATFNEVGDLSDIRIGVFEEWFSDCEADVLAKARQALAFLKLKGAEVVPIQIPNLELMSLAHGTNISTAFTMDIEKQLFDQPDTLEPCTRVQLALGGSMSGVEFLSTCWIRGWAVDFFDGLFEKERLSGFLTPTLGMPPPKMPDAAKSTGESNTTLVMELIKYIFPGNLCGLPSISIPAGLTVDGLPAAVCFTARHWDEHVCLRVANALDEPQFRSVPPRFVDLLVTAQQ